MAIRLNQRQSAIVEIVKKQSPITGDDIAAKMSLAKTTLRGDLTFLTQVGLLEARPRVGYYYGKKNYIYELYQKIIDLSVEDFMSLPIVIGEGSSAYDAVVELFTNNIGTLFVVREQGILEGVVSRKDLLKLSLGKADMHQVPVGVVMTRMPNVVMTRAEENLWMAAQKLIKHEIDALPVVREKDAGTYEVVGRLTKTNITRAFVELGEGYDENRGDL